MNFVKQEAIYMQIADFMLDNILAQKFNAGDRVQSVREMAASVQVNPNTVMRSFNYLQEEGIIYNKRGIGYFISDDALDKTIDIKKGAFVKTYLPQLFKTIDLLKMDFDELKSLYNDYHKSNLNGG